MEKKVSVIVPVYNVEKYLEKCLISILNQTYKNIEIIIINDGSKDDSGKICEKYAQKYNEVKYINKKNEGVSKARNIGIEHSTGEYIMFVDSDDYIEPDCIEFMIDKLNKYDIDIVICGTNNVDENGLVKNQNVNTKEKMIMNNIESLKYLLNEKPYNAVCWGKIFKKELLVNHTFNVKTKMAEDLELLYKIFWEAKKVLFCPEKKYNWLIRYNSTTKEKFNNKWKQEINICEDIIKFTKNNCIELEDYAIKRYIRINVTCAFKVIRSDGKKEDLKYLQGNIRKYKMKNNKILGKNYIIKILFILYFPWLIRIVMNLKNKK